MIEINKIYNENCLETLKNIPNDSIDLVVTSPPYNMNLRIRNGKYCSRQITKEFTTKYDGFDDNTPINEYYDFHLKVLKELIRTSSIIFYNIQIVTGSKRAFFKIINKNNAQPAMAKNVLNRRTELILIFDSKNAISRQFKKTNFDRGTLDDIWNIKRGKKIVNSHSAVFPEELVEHILKNFSNEGDLIYDPFMGTGTTAVVTKRMGRNYIGSELSNEYIKVIEGRLGN